MEITDYSAQTGGRSLDEAQEVIGKGHPPIADGVILIDFDGTLYPFGFLFDAPEPLPGAVSCLRALKGWGYTIGIFTSRLSPLWLDSVHQEAQQHIDYITTLCNRDGIPFDFITSEKRPCEAYIDDKAIKFDNNWSSILEDEFGIILGEEI